MTDRTGRSSPWPAIGAAVLILLIGALVYAWTSGALQGPASPRPMAVDLVLPRAPQLPDAPRIPAAPTPSPR